jgi:hypothetical protein
MKSLHIAKDLSLPANAIGRLRTLELITGRGTELRASEEFFA